MRPASVWPRWSRPSAPSECPAQVPRPGARALVLDRAVHRSWLAGLKGHFGWTYFDPWKQGESLRLKRKALRICGRAWNWVDLRRFHTQGWVRLVRRRPSQAGPGQPGGVELDEYSNLPVESDGARRVIRGTYDQVWDRMVDRSNGDGESEPRLDPATRCTVPFAVPYTSHVCHVAVRVLNHSYGELCVMLELGETTGRRGMTEPPYLLRKAWMPVLQQGPRAHYHIIHHMCRQHFGHYARSPRRNGLLFMNGAPNMTGQ